jgi:Haemolysin-III related
LSSSATRLRTHRGYSHGELIADGAVHAAAMIAGVIAFSVLFQKVAMRGAVGDGVAMAVYAAGFFFLFGFSCAYNMAPPSPAKAILRRFDHASIYLMIGGSYTALFSQARASFWVVALVSTVWIAALAGAFLKLFLPGRFDRFAVRLYLARLVGDLRDQAARRGAASRHARAHGCRRAHLFGWRRVLSVGEPQIPDRDLARLRRRSRRLPVRRRAAGGRPLTQGPTP